MVAESLEDGTNGKARIRPVCLGNRSESSRTLFYDNRSSRMVEKCTVSGSCAMLMF